MKNTRYLIMVLIMTYSAIAAEKVSPMVTTWDAGVSEGWSTYDGGAATYPVSGGVTGGYMSIEDITTGWMTIVAPSEYLGDYTDMNYVGFFSVAVRTLIQGQRAEALFATLTLSGPGGKYSVDMGDVPPPSSGWVIYSTQINESRWERKSGTWLGLLENVTSVTFVVEGYSPVEETTGVDNFTLGIGQVETPRIDSISANRCLGHDYGWYFVGMEGIERIDITFTEDVEGADSLSSYEFIAGLNQPLIPDPIYLSYDSFTWTTTIAWSSAIQNQTVTVRCISGTGYIRSADQNEPLDGEIANSDNPAFPSGDGIVGGDAYFTIRHLTGDFNHDKVVNLEDFAILSANWLNTID